MSDLLTVAEFITYRNISKKIDNDKVQESIDLAEQSDLYELLGDFYFDVLKNFADLTYADLMNGSAFTYEDEEFNHKGIKALLSDLANARYTYIVNVSDTPFGKMSKFTQDSNPIDRNLIKDLSKQSQADGGVKFKTIEKYIMSEPELFSRYCKNKSTGTGFFSQRFSKL